MVAQPARELVGGWLKGRWLAVVVTLVLAYFGYHALHGRYGFLAWIDTSRDLEAARQELARLAAERAALQRDVAGVPAATRSTATCSRRSCASWAMSSPTR